MNKELIKKLERLMSEAVEDDDTVDSDFEDRLFDKMISFIRSIDNDKLDEVSSESLDSLFDSIVDFVISIDSEKLDVASTKKLDEIMDMIEDDEDDDLDESLEEKKFLKKMTAGQKRKARVYRRKNKIRLKQWKKKYKRRKKMKLKRVATTGRGLSGKKLGRTKRRPGSK